ncbi:hypothetical protein [Croceibacterium ferulae]|uniref:hypothetical protein n=1 Tax=Croceibacterium ferulae TaxID=1854641 RepID=UPI000F85DF4F|nr:hypothetical protein [Croceibacterium ferulae]
MVLGHLLDEEVGSSLPEAARPMFRTMLDLLDESNNRMGDLRQEILRRTREHAIVWRLMTIHGVAPITFTASAALPRPGNPGQGPRLCPLARSGAQSTGSSIRERLWSRIGSKDVRWIRHEAIQHVRHRLRRTGSPTRWRASPYKWESYAGASAAR